ncbi:unnamed protein product [Ixodes persulcatus]
MSVWEKPDQVACREQLYFPSPYAGSRVCAFVDGVPPPQHTWTTTGRLRAAEPNEASEEMDGQHQHTYDVPFLRRPPCTEQLS